MYNRRERSEEQAGQDCRIGWIGLNRMGWIAWIVGLDGQDCRTRLDSLKNNVNRAVTEAGQECGTSWTGMWNRIGRTVEQAGHVGQDHGQGGQNCWAVWKGV